MLPWGEAAAVAAADRDLPEAVRLLLEEAEPVEDPVGPRVAAVDLQGEPAGDVEGFGVDVTHPMARRADEVLLLAVVVLSMLLLLGVWRRDPTVHELQLPADLALAELPRRALAGLIDLAPGIAMGLWGFGLAPEELHQRWPGRGLGATWQLMLPGLAAVAVVVLHTFIGEVTTSRSLGKWVTGLRVAGLHGNRPRAWQVAVRCGLKAFDLMAYLLLVLPLVSPYRQRLGDMVARTVVVGRAAPDPPAEPPTE